MKPVVHYKNNGQQRIVLGQMALVEPIDHPLHLVNNKSIVLTSVVKRIGAWGEFETANTIYRPDVMMNHDEKL